jgi:hypothetical protein
MALNDYLRQVMRLCSEQKQDFLNPESAIDFINRARREVANLTQCVRVTPPISGQIKSTSVITAGAGYSATPTVSITPPDFPSGQLPAPNGSQATAGAIVSGGTISSVTIGFGGYGYFQPQITITDATGTGATVTPNMTNMNLLLRGQERYDFANVDLSTFPGVSAITSVRSVSVLYSNYRYSLPKYAWTVYQAYVRQYPFQYQYVPTFCCQFGQGENGSMFFYPLPSQTYQMEWDCACRPQDLIDDQSVEILPYPWVDAVPFLACMFAFQSFQNYNIARYYEDQFKRYLISESNAARVGGMVNVYGRY